MVFACRQRRILRIVAFIGVACIIFLCFQVFLVGFLDHDDHLELRRGARPKFGFDDDELRLIDVPGGRTTTTSQLQQTNKSQCMSHNCSIPDNPIVSILRNSSQSHVIFSTMRLPNQSSLHDSRNELSQFESVWEFLEHNFVRPVILQQSLSEVHSTRGANMRWQYLYEADDRNQYTCILSQVSMSFYSI